jgi:CheY-like chemotaxis protein
MSVDRFGMNLSGCERAQSPRASGALTSLLLLILWGTMPNLCGTAPKRRGWHLTCLSSCAQGESAIRKETTTGLATQVATNLVTTNMVTTNMAAPQTQIQIELMIGSISAETVAVGGPKTILLVEDEAFVREAIAEALQSAGYTVLIARSAEEAIEACRRRAQPVDLLLADVVMPGMSGYELAAEFLALCPSAPVLLMSGYVDELGLSTSSPYSKTYVDSKAYLGKPFSISSLLNKVREALGGNSLQSKPPADSHH